MYFVFLNESPLYTYILIFLNTIQYIPNCVHIYNTNTTYSIYRFFITKFVFLCVFQLLPTFSRTLKTSLYPHF